MLKKYIEGFVKRAEEIGMPKLDALMLFKQAHPAIAPNPTGMKPMGSPDGAESNVLQDSPIKNDALKSK